MDSIKQVRYLRKKTRKIINQGDRLISIQLNEGYQINIIYWFVKLMVFLSFFLNSQDDSKSSEVTLLIETTRTISHKDYDKL